MGRVFSGKKINKQTKRLSSIGAALFAVSQIVVAADDHANHGHGEHEHTSAAQASQHVHHSHGVGAWMFEYRFMRMDMDGLLDGTDNVSTEEISGATMVGGEAQKTPGKDYLMAPTAMTMDMHMLMAMYGVNDKLSVMGMLNYLDNDMDMVMHMTMPNGARVDRFSDMQTSGIGDTQIGAMYQVRSGLVASMMLSIPTGSIDEKVEMMGRNVRAAYPMQLGSGTYDLIPAITYNAGMGDWSYGGQAEYTYRISENDNDYALGDRLALGAWLKRSLNSTVNVAGRLNIVDWGKIDGADPDINVMMTPTGDPDAQGGTRADLVLDVSANFGGHTLGLAYGVPVYQDLNGPQMELQSIITFSYQYMTL
ncbi:MAG: alpha amylase [Gammaproteobacteria bacterium]|nr:alpha amylase [Gammaproteobacteria bacterium]